MSKIHTPMQRLKASYDNIFKIMQSTGFSVIEEQYQEARDTRGYDNYKTKRKGVDSDFIRIFNVDDSTSFAFKYTFLSEDKKSPCDVQYFEVVFKQDNDYKNSRMYSIDEAKDLLKGIYSMLKIMNSPTKEKIHSLFVNTCRLTEESVSESKLNLKQKIKAELGEDLATLETEKSNKEILENRLKDSISKLDNYRLNMDEAVEIRHLEIKVQSLKAKVKSNAAKMEKDLNIQQDKNFLVSANNTIKEINASIKAEVLSNAGNYQLSSHHAEEIILELQGDPKPN